jgi:hypothetical protein
MAIIARDARHLRVLDRRCILRQSAQLPAYQAKDAHGLNKPVKIIEEPEVSSVYNDANWLFSRLSEQGLEDLCCLFVKS